MKKFLLIIILFFFSNNSFYKEIVFLKVQFIIDNYKVGKYYKEKTIIMITHRETLAKESDLIVDLNKQNEI